MNFTKFNINWHQKISWWSLVAVILWVLSGISHPLMSWFGPQAQKFFPPTMQLESGDLDNLLTILNSKKIATAKVIKVVPSEEGPMLQITYNPTSPRQYFSLANGSERPNYDIAQARWLANYYSGKPSSEIKSIQFQTSFDQQYPWVNRLLPIYKVQYLGEDNLTLYIHTETLALASINNQFKRVMQFIFQQLHTFQWLDFFEFGRVLVIALFMLCLAGVAFTGSNLVLLLKSKKKHKTDRKLHRLLANFLWLPLLAWSASGFYHLCQQSFIEPVTGLRLSETPLKLTENTPNFRWPSALPKTNIANISLIEGRNGNPIYRLSINSRGDKNQLSRREKYRGQSHETQALFLGGTTGRIDSEMTDERLVRHLALKYLAINDEAIASTTLITRYSPDYDFRNKRLPVWQVKLNTPEKHFLFIDPITGILVDQSRAIDRAERWSFSILHKWNLLSPIIGRFYRDIAIVFTLLLILILSALGTSILLKRKSTRTRATTQTTAHINTLQQNQDEYKYKGHL